MGVDSIGQSSVESKPVVFWFCLVVLGNIPFLWDGEVLQTAQRHFAEVSVACVFQGADRRGTGGNIHPW